ncbi:hypothetical protein BDV26DRAFT_156367 [Aspergillus bertholletiae]|uniref:Uncharacterized protein n=1 Tax=Aspergillus bertholletiae TaxID=1226010 RepID=A0A5N7BD86_9EURO|nr:hypothetical protein BDV26DRAFT_156367 [Aspergillus bertholletiae]
MDSPSVPLTSLGNSSSLYTNGIIPPTSKGITVIIVDGILMFLTIFFTALRISSRRLRRQKLFPEDYLQIGSLVGRK